MKTITVKYFAALKAKANKDSELYNTNASDLSTLYKELVVKYGFSLEHSLIRFAKNHEFVNEDCSFDDNDIIALIPPVSGG